MGVLCQELLEQLQGECGASWDLGQLRPPQESFVHLDREAWLTATPLWSSCPRAVVPRLPDIAVVWTEPLPRNPYPRVLVWPLPGLPWLSPVPTEGLPQLISLARLLDHAGHIGLGVGARPRTGWLLRVILQGQAGPARTMGRHSPITQAGQQDLAQEIWG